MNILNHSRLILVFSRLHFFCPKCCVYSSEKESAERKFKMKQPPLPSSNFKFFSRLGWTVTEYIGRNYRYVSRRLPTCVGLEQGNCFDSHALASMTCFVPTRKRTMHCTTCENYNSSSNSAFINGSEKFQRSIFECQHHFNVTRPTDRIGV